MRNRYEAVNKLLADQDSQAITLTPEAQEELEFWIGRDLPVCDPLEAAESTARRSLEIQTLKGKKTKKFWQVSITRTDGGFWEVNHYCL
jgi:hypothetical protein